MAFFCAGATHGTAKKKPPIGQIGSKPVSLSQGSPLTSGPPSLGERGGGEGGGKPNNEINITLPHSNTQAMKKKMIVVQKYEPKPSEKGLAVNRGETVLLIRDDGDWLYVKNESGAEGFVPRSHLLSPSTTRTRTNSRSGTALRNITSNGSAVPMHPTRSTDRPQRCDKSPGGHRVASPLSQDESQHAVSNGHPPRLATEALYDHKYSPSSSSGVASLADPFSPGSNQSPNQSPTQENEDRVQSSSSSLNHSHGSYSSYEQSLDTNSQPTLISPLNHIEGGREGLGRGVGTVDKRSSEALPSSNSGRTSSNLHSPSARVPPLSPPPQNSTQSSNVHYVDKTTNHIYSTLEEMPSSPPPPPLPPRNMQAYSASQEPEQSAYSQLDHHYQQQQQQQQGGGGTMHKTCSQEALVHPSHRHNSYSEGWTRDRKTVGHTAIQQSSTSRRSRVSREPVELRQVGQKSDSRSSQGTPKQPRTATDRRRQQNRNSQTKITKFRKTVWGVFVVTHNFDPLDENEVAISKGEHVSVWNQDDRDWFWVVKHASSNSEEGFVPSGCLREVSAESKTSSAVESADSVVRQGSNTTTTSSGSTRPDDLSDPMRHRSQSHESRSINSVQNQQPQPPSRTQQRPSSGGVIRNDSHRERRSSESGSQVHRLRNRVPSNLSIQKDDLPPSPPSSPPPPYTEFDTSQRFVSLSQQPAEVHHSQPTQGYTHGMHRTRSQGYVTSRARAHHYPSSPSTPRGERRGETGGFPPGGTLV